ncbi:aminotransferase [Helicobacter didelphidarum]|uniref:Aminotransferase n=1 Tax=Helicobacter didelphidarum TaxID=2040648 RepID=A0A3D8IDH1_9HELI|nr:aminotransferase class I/II-fold pyridoxal phosphate-dependent enzyme [Helicobacter didelphidarum]RDU63199.1 aminotransferase [Helicobacter didelphidarum]
MENVEQTINRRDILKVGSLVGAVALGGLLSPMQAVSQPFKNPTRDKPLLLDSNENAYGFSSLIEKNLVKELTNMSLYPIKPEQQLLTDIAKFYNVKEDRVCLTNGSSAALQSALYAVNKMAQEANLPLRIIVPNPTFEFIEAYAKPLDPEIIKVELDSKFNFDIDKMKKSEMEFDGVSLVYICNPNNPTGNIANPNDLYSWVRNAKSTTIFLFDESYAEYVADSGFKSGIDMLKGGAKNIIITRTFSKVYGLAGCRIGYVLTTPELQKRVSEFLQLVGINFVGAKAASIALKDFNFRQYTINSNIKSREIVTRTLDSLGLKYAPSHGNFIFHEIAGDFDDFVKNMKNQNVLVGRKFDVYDNFCRVTLGTPDQMQYYVKLLKNFREKRYI